MKNKKRSKANHSDNFIQPLVRNMDEIAILTDDELTLLLNDLQGQRDQAKLAGASTYESEVEICYVKRELQLRKIHHQAHLEYESLEDSYQDDADLPSADLDNTSYVQAWHMWKGRSRSSFEEIDDSN